MKSAKNNKGMKPLNPHLIWGFALKWGAWVERLAKVIWNMYRAPVNSRLYSSVMLKPSYVQLLLMCAVPTTDRHICTLAGCTYMD